MQTPFIVLAVIKGLLCTFLTISVANLPSQPIKWPLVMVCLCGLAGDVFLVDDALFMFGLGSFLIGHLIYWWCFHRLGQYKMTLTPSPQHYLIILLSLAGVVFLSIYHTRFGDLFPAVMIYAAILINMAIQALRMDTTTLNQKAVLWIQVGAICFVISDLFIAYTFFITSHQWMAYSIWALYCAAQLGLVGGCIQIVQSQKLRPVH